MLPIFFSKETISFVTICGIIAAAGQLFFNPTPKLLAMPSKFVSRPILRDAGAPIRE